MRTNTITIETIGRENFLRYGDAVEVLRPDPGKARRGEDEHRALVRVPSNGWAIGLVCVRARWTDTLEAHGGRRLLAPREGSAVLCVAPRDRPQNPQIFMLDRAVALSPAIPHRLLTLTAESWVLVCEDIEAPIERRRLRRSLAPAETSG